jgi:lipoprotein-releasing system ATP-binding protein
MNMISVKNIKKSYGSLEVLKGVDLEIAKGEVVSIVGKSGAGKSTLLHIIGTLDGADSGTVIINGEDVGQLKSKALAKFRNDHIGFVFQFHHLLPEFTALENVCIPAFIKKTSEKEAKRRAAELLEYLGLADRMTHKPTELSGGEQQRVAVARALMNQPAVILADEPSGNLDTTTSKELHELFFQLRKDFDQTFVIVTHNTELAAMSDRTLEMKDGLIIAEKKQTNLDVPVDLEHLERLEAQQDALAKKVVIEADGSGYIPTQEDLIFSLDIQYVGEEAYVAIDVQKANGELLGTYVSKEATGMEYVPRYFAFREGPPLLSALKKLEAAHGLKAKLLIVDGHGIAHPRRLGVASWLGVQMDTPTIGMAKKTLLQYTGDAKQERGSQLPIMEEGETLGCVLRTQTDIQPVFVSIGHKISLTTAVQVLLELSEEGYRIPEPLRRADQAARAYAKGESIEGMIII